MSQGADPFIAAAQVVAQLVEECGFNCGGTSRRATDASDASTTEAGLRVISTESERAAVGERAAARPRKGRCMRRVLLWVGIILIFALCYFFSKRKKK